MIIKKILLENIRSFIKEEINFSKGTTLLVGDVGSGKSTILLAIDFALFGVRKGELSGNSLLRNGAEEGSVELVFEVDGKDVVIKRFLKRTKKGVVQEGGYLSLNGEEKITTNIELKQAILDVLNYPKSMLTKKSLVYRYTVYTPQEQMKFILSGERELRVDTLRKVFGVDKYKKIIDNTKIFVSFLKEKRKEFAGMVYDLSEKLKFRDEVDNQLNLLNGENNLLEKEINGINSKYNELRKKVFETKERVGALGIYKNELENIKSFLKNKLEQVERNEERLRLLLGKNDDVISRKEVKEEELTSKGVEIENCNIKIREIESKTSVLNYRILSSRNIIEKISKLSVCPTCQQEVKVEHKDKIVKAERDNTLIFEKELKELKNDLSDNVESLRKLSLELEKLRAERREYQLYLKGVKENEEKKKLKENIGNEQKLLFEELEKFSSKKNELIRNIKSLELLVHDFEAINNEFLKIENEKKELEIKKATLEGNISLLKRNLLNLKKEVDEKLKIKEKFEHYGKIESWFNELFLMLVSEMERNVMLRLYVDFNELFKKWFEVIIDNMTVSLDRDFTPIIEQNGYQLEYDFLSGGEKTSVALAYRLALNHVVNNVVSNINTKDILILDEPTDGFSDEQLDRLGEILRNLTIGQIIIVSHERKIESFVNNVIRLEKEGFVSGVI